MHPASLTVQTKALRKHCNRMLPRGQIMGVASKPAALTTSDSRTASFIASNFGV
jgi:hypothetical protein